MISVRGVFVYVALRFAAKRRKTSNAVEMSSLIFQLQATEMSFGTPYGLIHFETLINRSLNMRQMSPAQTRTTERTAERK